MKQILILEDNELTRNKMIRIIKSMEKRVNVHAFSNEEEALRRRFSHTGYAVWNYILETLTDSENFELDFREVNRELLAADYELSVEELTEIVAQNSLSRERKKCGAVGITLTRI